MQKQCCIIFFFENFGENFITRKICSKKGKFGVKWSKYAQICPKKVILCQNNGILAKYAKICSIKLGSFYSEFSESQKKYRYAQTPTTWKICKSIFCLSLITTLYEPRIKTIYSPPKATPWKSKLRDDWPLWLESDISLNSSVIWWTETDHAKEFKM